MIGNRLNICISNLTTKENIRIEDVLRFLLTPQYEQRFSFYLKIFRLSELNLNCDFSINLCDWHQEMFKDEIDLTRNKGKSLLAKFNKNSGPIADRNGNEGKFFIRFSLFLEFLN